MCQKILLKKRNLCGARQNANQRDAIQLGMEPVQIVERMLERLACGGSLPFRAIDMQMMCFRDWIGRRG